MTIGIDASRNRSGGAKAHLIGIVSELDPRLFGIQAIHVWAFRALLDELPNYPWLIKHNPKALEQSLFKQVWWQATALAIEVRAAGCDILFTTDASTLCRFRPMVVLSQDMLSYEPRVMSYFGFTLERLRLVAILFIQNLTFRFADGVIFLTRYAAETIQKSCGRLAQVAIIPHGVGDEFKRAAQLGAWPEPLERPIRCLYVSNTALYKHQWIVVRAIAALRRRGFFINLTLVGGGGGRPQAMLDAEIAAVDPDSSFVTQMEFMPQRQLPGMFATADLFIFASSCENLPVTLLEAMAVGLPIACSGCGPMPEVLEDGGVYFDPENPDSIAAAIETLILDEPKRRSVSVQAKKLSCQYSWSRCARETFSFIVQTVERVNISESK